MGSQQEAVERLLRPLQGTLETRGEDEESWSRAHVTLRMNLWWLIVRDNGNSEKKSRITTLLKFRKRKETDLEERELSEEENEWRNADGYLQLVRSKDSEEDSRVEWLSENSGESRKFKVVSNGACREFRLQHVNVARIWKKAIEMRLMSWERMLKIGSGSFRELFIGHSGSNSFDIVEEKKALCKEEIGRRKNARMECCKFVLKEIDAGLNVGVQVERNSGAVTKGLRTAIDLSNFLSAAPYVGYAFRVVGLGLELAIRLAEENQALQKARNLLEEIVKKVVRALIYAKENDDGVGFYDFLNLIEKCEAAGHEVELCGLRSTKQKVKNIILREAMEPTEIVAVLQDLCDQLNRDLGLNTYHHIVALSRKASLVRRESSDGSKTICALLPWPEEISVSDGGSYVGNSELLGQISKILRQDKGEEGSVRDEMVAQKFIVSSLGGMGKTELVKQYARIERDVYKGGVYWVEAEKEETLLKSFQVIREQIRMFLGYDSRICLEEGREREFKESEEHDQLKVDCKKFFRRLGWEKGAWLLIFDNADEINGDEDFRLKWIPAIGFGHVLVTTRLHVGHQKLNTFAEACNPTHVTDSLKKLGVDDAQSLLLFHAGRREGKLSEEETGYVGRIVGPKNLDGHPLALVQAGRYLRETLMSFKEYAELLCRSDVPEVIMPDEDEKEEEKRSILKTFLPSKEKLSEAAKELLSVLCWLPPDGITERDLRICSDPSINAFHNSSLQKYIGEGEKGSDERNVLLRERKWMKVVGEVCKYGLIQRVRKGEEVVICAHRLVYAVERESLKKAEEESRLRCAIVTAIMLLQHHLQMPKNNSKTIPSSHFHEKHNYSKSWNTANLHIQLGYFLNEYDTYSHGEVFRLYQYAANLDYPTAIHNLGFLYRNGDGVEKDEKRAAELYGKAAKLGHAPAMSNLAFMYENGRGVEKDEKRAAELYGKAAKLGYARAMNNLGNLYRKGNGVEKDKKRAAELYGKAAKLGDVVAICSLGSLYKKGRGVEKDEKRAAELYGKAAKLGYARAMNNLGNLYRKGNGVGKNEKRAGELYNKAVELGNTLAMNNLGRLYKEGKGVKKDESRADELFRMARSLGGSK